MTHSAGTVAIYTDHIARFSDFTVSITGLEIPEGTVYKWARGVYLAYNTNEFIRNMHGDWIFFMDDDHRFEPDILLRLLDHNVDVVCALTSKKFPPFEPVIYQQKDKGLTPITLPNGGKGLIEVDACGKPGMLIRKHVLDQINDPWCEFRDTQEGSEDMDLSMKIKNAGFKIYCDLDTKLAHMAPVAFYKQQDPSGQWGTSIVMGDKVVFIHD